MAQRKFMADVSYTLSIESGLSRLSLEESIFADSIDTFKTILPGLSTKITDVLASIENMMKTNTVQESKLAQSSKKLRVKLPEIKYGNVEKMLVSIPAGFNGSLVLYVRDLNSLASGVYKETLETIQDYHVILSSFITNKEVQTSFETHKNFLDRVSGARSLIEEKMKHYYPENSSATKTYFGKVVDRMADMDVLIRSTEELYSSHNAANLNEINKRVKMVVELMDIVIKQIASQDITKVSSKVAKGISEGAYGLARHIEQVAAFNFQCELAIGAVVDLVEKLEEVS